jgi:hypothetical protein
LSLASLSSLNPGQGKTVVSQEPMGHSPTRPLKRIIAHINGPAGAFQVIKRTLTYRLPNLFLRDVLPLVYDCRKNRYFMIGDHCSRCATFRRTQGASIEKLGNKCSIYFVTVLLKAGG